MKSDTPKILHQVAKRSMMGHVLAALMEAGATQAAVVIGLDRHDAEKEVCKSLPDARIFVQRERLGTAHAALSAREALAETPDDVIISFGDTTLVRTETSAKLRVPLANGAAVVVMALEVKDPTGYGA